MLGERFCRTDGLMGFDFCFRCCGGATEIAIASKPLSPSAAGLLISGIPFVEQRLPIVLEETK
jgi:hypothetical protein